MIILKIDKIRQSIDKLDEQILNNIANRKKLVRQIAKIKKSMKMPVFDRDREKYIINKLKNKAKKKGLQEKFVVKLFKIILENSKIDQKPNK